MGKRHQHTQGFGGRRVGGLGKNVHFLILSEDTESSFSYFNAMIESVQAARHSQVIGISSTVKGIGRGTGVLLRKAEAKKIEAERKSQIPFDRCWLVFDKDDFKDFNQVIKEATNAGFEVAWSNESFELWYLLHFRICVKNYEDGEARLNRKDCIKALENEIKKHDATFIYEKKDSMHGRLAQYGDQNLAIAQAEELRELHMGGDYASHNPCTRVDMLVKELTDLDKRREILKRSSRTK